MNDLYWLRYGMTYRGTTLPSLAQRRLQGRMYFRSYGK